MSTTLWLVPSLSHPASQSSLPYQREWRRPGFPGPLPVARAPQGELIRRFHRSKDAIGRSLFLMAIIHVGTAKPNPGPYEADRRCTHEVNGVRCITVLSRYRPGPCCEAHTPEPDAPLVMKARLSWLAEQEAAA